jgi:DNA-binding LacI/PurR family transcriptional regulator
MGNGPTQNRKRRATSYDVARLAGVSQSAVSRSFKPGASIAPETRDRVMAAATRLGYQPDAIARGLITKRSGIVAILISNLTNLYYPEVLAELSQELSARDIRVLLFSLANESEVDRVLDQIWRYRVDGVISAARLTDAQIRQFGERGVPLVLYNRAAEAVPCASVSCDSAGGERELVTRLLDTGHARFAILAGPEDSTVGEERVAAARALLERAGHSDIPLARGSYSYESGEACMRELLRQGDAPDAVICANDVMAIGAMDAARAHDLRVPEQISIVGFDGVAPARWASYRLTTIRQPVRRMTRAAIAMLAERIDNPDLIAERRVFSGELILGASARIPAA